MSIYTVKEIHSDYWVEFPIYDDAVKRVEELDKIDKYPTLGQYIMFK